MTPGHFVPRSFAPPGGLFPLGNMTPVTICEKQTEIFTPKVLKILYIYFNVLL